MKGIGTHIHDMTGTADDGDRSAPRQDSSTLRHRVRRAGAIVTGITAVGAVALVTTAVSVYGTEDPRSLAVVISDAGSSPSDECGPGEYDGTFFDGVEVTLADAEGAALATRVVDGDAQASEYGCFWTLSFDAVPVSSGYTLELTEQAGRRQHSFEYSPDRLDAMDWSVWVSAVA